MTEPLSTFNVTVGKVPGVPQSVTLERGHCTISDALSGAGMSADRCQVAVNNVPTTNMDTPLNPDDRVLLFGKISGN